MTGRFLFVLAVATICPPMQAACPLDTPSGLAASPAGEVRLAAWARLCGDYLKDVPDNPTFRPAGSWIEEIAVRIGSRLQRNPGSVPAEDLAMLSLLMASPAAQTAAAPQPRPPAPPADSQTNRTAQGPVRPVAGPQALNTAGAAQQEINDLTKGQEGFRQGIEALGSLPLSDRLVFTGDITAGLQAATVPSDSDLTSAFGRARLNVVARAVPTSGGGRLSEGYFFMQLRAAGGPFDSFPVGGPRTLTPLNDVATDRSRYNEGTSRGNVYLSKVFYQQRINLGQDFAIARIGIVNLSDFFDTSLFANNEARQFINSAFVNSAAYKTGISAPGAMAEYYRKGPRPWLDQMVVRGGYALSRTDRAFTSPIWSSELELRTLLSERRGYWRAGGTLGNVAGAGRVSEFHLSADHWVGRNTGVFGRYAIANSGPGSLALGPAHQSYSGGFQWRLVDQGDRVSAWSVGFSQAFPLQQGLPLVSEKVFETYYRWQISDNLSLTPDFQLVSGAGGRPSNGFQAVFGVRMNFGLR